MDVAQEVKKIIEETVFAAGLILDDVLYVKEDGNYFLRVVLDKNGIVDIEDCVKITKLIDPMLDEIDISDSYILDVCSKEKGCE